MEKETAPIRFGSRAVSFFLFCRGHSGARSSPKKNTATVPGPAWDAMIVPISQMRISP